jgi:hypothetical protein
MRLHQSPKPLGVFDHRSRRLIAILRAHGHHPHRVSFPQHCQRQAASRSHRPIDPVRPPLTRAFHERQFPALAPKATSSMPTPKPISFHLCLTPLRKPTPKPISSPPMPSSSSKSPACRIHILPSNNTYKTISSLVSKPSLLASPRSTCLLTQTPQNWTPQIRLCLFRKAPQIPIER